MMLDPSQPYNVFAFCKALSSSVLSRPARRLLQTIAIHWADSAGVCHPSIDGIADASGLKRRRVFDLLREACDAGWVMIQSGGGRTRNTYALMIGQTQDLNISAVQKTARHPCRKLHGTRAENCTAPVQKTAPEHPIEQPKYHPTRTAQEKSLARTQEQDVWRGYAREGGGGLQEGAAAQGMGGDFGADLRACVRGAFSFENQEPLEQERSLKQGQDLGQEDGWEQEGQASEEMTLEQLVAYVQEQRAKLDAHRHTEGPQGLGLEGGEVEPPSPDHAAPSPATDQRGQGVEKGRQEDGAGVQAHKGQESPALGAGGASGALGGAGLGLGGAGASAGLGGAVFSEAPAGTLAPGAVVEEARGDGEPEWAGAWRRCWARMLREVFGLDLEALRASGRGLPASRKVGREALAGLGWEQRLTVVAGVYELWGREGVIGSLGRVVEILRGKVEAGALLVREWSPLECKLLLEGYGWRAAVEEAQAREEAQEQEAQAQEAARAAATTGEAVTASQAPSARAGAAPADGAGFAPMRRRVSCADALDAISEQEAREMIARAAARRASMPRPESIKDTTPEQAREYLRLVYDKNNRTQGGSNESAA